MERTKIIHKYLFIAVKPEYANKLISGEKSIELRKNRPRVQPGDYVIIYASTPLKAVVGFGKIKNIIECSPDEMWAKHSMSLGIEKKKFDMYYSNHKKSIGIEFETIRPIVPICLDDLKKADPDFHPPQVYRYVTNDEISIVLSQKIKQKSR